MLCVETSFVEHLLNSVTARAPPESLYQRDLISENHHISVINGNFEWMRKMLIHQSLVFV